MTEITIITVELKEEWLGLFWQEAEDFGEQVPMSSHGYVAYVSMVSVRERVQYEWAPLGVCMSNTLPA